MDKFFDDIFAWFGTKASHVTGWISALTTEQKAGWVTAVSTTIQTVAVTATLVVAAVEYFGHKQQDTRIAHEATIKLFSDEPSDLQELRDYASSMAECVTLNPTDPSKGHLACPDPFPSDSEIHEKLAPLISYLRQY